MATVSTHLAISERFLNHGIAEVAAGDLLQGSEKLWGAAAHMIKAVAEQRGWRHKSHRDMFSAVDEIVAQTGEVHTKNGFRHANRLHWNFYEDGMSESEIQESAGHVADFLDRLDAIVHERL